MKSRVLYFPYIRVPQSSWLTQMLLYWDQVSSIVPYEFVHKPESLGPHMLSLVREGLVVQVIPAVHLDEIPRFCDAFGAYIDSLGHEIAHRRKRFARGSSVRIHIEKMRDIGDSLVRERLAASGQYPWYEVERETADDFMSYLAASLGHLQSIDAAPVTDDRSYLSRLARAGVPDGAMTMQLDSLRVQVLEQVLPVPRHAVDPSRLRAFKEGNRHELADFRRHVERELVDAASISDASLRDRRLQIFFDEAKASIDEIQEAMRGAGWETAKTSFSVLAAIPGVNPLLGLAGAVWDAVTGAGSPQQGLRDFAYAAHVRSKLTEGA